MLIGSLIAHGSILYWVGAFTKRTPADTVSVPILVHASSALSGKARPRIRARRKRHRDDEVRDIKSFPQTSDSDPKEDNREELMGLNDVLGEGNDAPIYPPEAEEAGWEGEVWLRLRLFDTGRVRQVEIIKSSGYAVLDQAATRAASEWNFRVGWVADEEPTARLVPIAFKLLE